MNEEEIWVLFRCCSIILMHCMHPIFSYLTCYESKLGNFRMIWLLRIGTLGISITVKLHCCCTCWKFRNTPLYIKMRISTFGHERLVMYFMMFGSIDCIIELDVWFLDGCQRLNVFRIDGGGGWLCSDAALLSFGLHCSFVGRCGCLQWNCVVNLKCVSLDTISSWLPWYLSINCLLEVVLLHAKTLIFYMV
jgi:hypothetical protein